MLLCVDFDETLYPHDDPETWQKNLEALELWRYERNETMIISGRNWKNFQKICPKWETIADYLVLDNGGVIFGKGGWVDELVAFSQEALDEVRSRAADEGLTVYYTPYDLGLEQPGLMDLIKIRLWFRDLETLWKWDAESKKSSLVQSLPYPRAGYSSLEGIDLREYAGFIDVVPKGGGKENAIWRIVRRSCVAKRDVIVVGDDYNDIGMIREFAGHAMTNAPDEVVQAARGKRVTAVWRLLEELMEPKWG